MLRSFATLMLALAVAGCSASASQDAAAPSDLVPSTVTAGALATILDNDPLDPATATDVSSLFEVGADPSRLMKAGTWYAEQYSNPVLFELPVDGHLAEVGRGSVVIEVGEDPSDFDAAIEIVEVAAYATSDGPLPVGEVAPDAAWGGATKLDSGSFIGPNGVITWIEVVYEANNVDDSRKFDCPYVADNPCLDAFVLDQNALVVEVDRSHRYVTVEVDGRRFVVGLVSPRFSDVDALRQLTIDVAASITFTPPREYVEVSARRLEELVVSGSPIPAGTWVGEVNGALLTFVVEEDIDGIRFLNDMPTIMGFGNLDHTVFLDFVRFDRFVPSVDVRVPTIERPLTNEEMRNGLEQVADVTVWEQVTVGGLPAVRLEFVPFDPAVECSEAQRAEWEIADELSCFSLAFADAGPLVWTNEDPYPVAFHYVESLGLLVNVPIGDADPEGAFAELMGALKLSKPS